MVILPSTAASSISCSRKYSIRISWQEVATLRGFWILQMVS